MQSTYSIKEATEMILLGLYAADLPNLTDLIEKSDLIKKNDKIENTKLSDNSISSIENNNIETFDNLLLSVKDKKAISLYTMLIDQIKLLNMNHLSIKLNFVDKNN